jgi:hypothetical protein
MGIDKTLHKMQHDRDPADVVREAIGDFSGLELYDYQILIGSYIRPERTEAGLIQTDTSLDEDKWQGKVGLILDIGPKAQEALEIAADRFPHKRIPKIGDWVFFKTHDGFLLTVNGHECRVLEEKHLRGRVAHPDMIL